MARPRKKVILPHLNDCGGDLTREWYIEYSYRNPDTDSLERTRLYEGFKKLSTLEDRYKHASLVIDSLTIKLKNGWTPYDREEFIFEDPLAYEFSSSLSGKQVTTTSHLHKLLSEYVEYKSTEVRKKSLTTYISKLRMFNQWAEQNGINDPKKITEDDITSFLKKLIKDKNLARLSIGKYRQILYSFFEYILRKKITVHNPVVNIPVMGNIVDKAPYPIQKDDRATFSAIIKRSDPQVWLACCMMYYMGIRPGQEIRLMKIGQINMNSRKITIKSNNAKNSTTETIDMPDQLYNELIPFHLNLYPSDFYVFSKNGRPGSVHLGENTLRNRFNSIRDKNAYSKEYKFYSWKHTGAEALADAGIDPWVMQSHLRHKSIETTERYARKRLGKRNESIIKKFPDIL